MVQKSNKSRQNQTGQGVDVRAARTRKVKNKDQLGSDRSATYTTPGARDDTFGSEHNRDNEKKAKRKMGGAGDGRQNLKLREVGQDTRKAKSRAHLNKQAAEGHKPQRSQKHTANK